MESRELRAMRTMAWERAKGEIEAMKTTYYASGIDDRLERFIEVVDSFIEHIENHGLQE